MDDCISDIDCFDLADPEELELADEAKIPFFYVTKESVEVLLGCRATAEQICAFITVAKSRHSNKNFLTAGSNAISKCLGVRPQKAKRIFSELTSLTHNGINLVKALPYAPIRRSVKFVDKGSSYGATLFLGHLVGHKTATIEYPISKLCKAGDTAARLFLYLHSHCSPEVDGYIASGVAETQHLKEVNGISIAYGQAPDLNLPIELLQSGDRELSEALQKLIDLKLMESVVVVKAEKPGVVLSTHYYDIHVKGESLRGSIRESIMKVAQEEGVYQGRADGRSHDGRYHTVAPIGYNVSLFRVLRPLYRYKPSSSCGSYSLDTFMLNSWLSSLNRVSILADPQKFVTSAMSTDVEF